MSWCSHVHKSTFLAPAMLYTYYVLLTGNQEVRGSVLGDRLRHDFLVFSLSTVICPSSYSMSYAIIILKDSVRNLLESTANSWKFFAESPMGAYFVYVSSRRVDSFCIQLQRTPGALFRFWFIEGRKLSTSLPLTEEFQQWPVTDLFKFKWLFHSYVYQNTP